MFRKDAEDTAYRIAKKSLKLNLSWKQPSFLRVPKNYEQILEVSVETNYITALRPLKDGYAETNCC